MKTLTVFGTRPEAIKMCPLVLALEKDPSIESVVCVTGQHREMLDQVLSIFNVKTDYDLNIMKPRQTLGTITSSIIEQLEPVIKEVRPDVVLVHGDTTTSMASALAAFYQKVPVGHVEAGLRTYDIYSPFPEEMNRKIISAISTLHFAPTKRNKEALEKESVRESVFVTGNTVIDAFQYTTEDHYVFENEILRGYQFGDSTILMTAHRRENLGKPLEHICEAVLELCDMHPELQVVYPVHLNPAVRETVFGKLGGCDQVTLIDPIDVKDMHNAMMRSKLVLTDSGGLQEEAPHLGKPVVVLRTETERPEAVAAGTAVVAGVEKESIVRTVNDILTDKDKYTAMSEAINPYGDGKASQRIVAALKTFFL
ncbi:non-hydrolyzing UDP-N-acetylglucosamine 2-epimerase [Adlercreutzia sp. ZJ242]|uniref:non-hydrolyzing UDP-N-acetylglucosamine 2-epimerase n=1 Tax=Adlercreutzia sp. ZJ242 TaxID=2709409 RepID=UPI0013EC6C5C|nr:UDP-N-acetylglucosamine 2-epimerase (non-hydrolyzing) [Adlercreutzia sp. ZJ242]